MAAVAEELTLHRNMVRYRLAQITELTGYDPAETSDRVQLWLALAVQRLSAGSAPTRPSPSSNAGSPSGDQCPHPGANDPASLGVVPR